MNSNSEYSIYIHIPFCRQRCNYCDFNTYAGLENRIPDYVTALCQEIQLIGQTSPYRLPIKSIYLGGGTPSLLPPLFLEKIINHLDMAFNLYPDLEMTLEANPGTVNGDYFCDIKQVGVNRVSLGVQSIHPQELRILNRIHDTFDTIHAISAARKAGIENISFDLIYGFPTQTRQSWKQTLEFINRLQPNHISAYGLTVEPGTKLEHWISKGLLPAPDEDSAADMYLDAERFLMHHGFIQYEVSNWAISRHPQKQRTDFPSYQSLYASQHNLQYWHNLPYLGLGAGAHGYAAGIRYCNVKGVQAYIHQMKNPVFSPQFPCSPALDTSMKIDLADEIQETMMVGLRLTQEGINETEFEKRFKRTLISVYEKQISRLLAQGLLEWHIESQIRYLRLTRRGRLLGNLVFMEFLNI